MIQDIMRFSSEDFKSHPDEDVLALCRKHPEIFVVIVERYEEAFLRKARSILWNKEDAEEVVQDTFTRIYVYADRYNKKEGASFSSWAYTILTRLAYTRYVKLRKERERGQDLDPEVFERLPDHSDFREELSVTSEVLVALSKLPDQAARILRLQFIEGKTQEEIAEEEGITVSAVKTRVHRAKKLFKKAHKDTETL